MKTYTKIIDTLGNEYSQVRQMNKDLEQMNINLKNLIEKQKKSIFNLQYELYENNKEL